MKAIVLLFTLTAALAYGSVASAQYGSGVPGGYFGGGGLSSGGNGGGWGGGSTFGIPGSGPSYGGLSSGAGSGALFRGFTYSPYDYSSPSYGRLSPSFGGSSSGLGFGTASSLGFPVPTYGVNGPYAGYGAFSYRVPSHEIPYFGSPSHLYGTTFRPVRDRSPAARVSYYATGFGYPPTGRPPLRVHSW